MPGRRPLGQPEFAREHRMASRESSHPVPPTPDKEHG